MKSYSKKAKKFYDSAVWKRTSKAYAASKFYLCERCGKPGYIVHHKIHLNDNNIDDPEISLNWDNLEYLCIECHNIIHKSNSYNGCMFDSNGQLIKK